MNEQMVISTLHADFTRALQSAQIAGFVKYRFGNVRISEREAIGQYGFSKKTLQAFEDSRDGTVKRTGGKANSRKLYPLYALVEIEQAAKMAEEVNRCDILIREHERNQRPKVLEGNK